MPLGPDQTTKDYVHAFQIGEERAYDYFFRLYFRALCFFARKLLQNQHNAEDIVQDCFTRLWGKRTRLNNPDSIRAYLYSSVRNACISHLRKKKIHKITLQLTDDVQLEDEDTLFNDNLIKSEILREIHASLEQLPAGRKQVLQLYYFQGKSDSEISQLLSISPLTARNQRLRAISTLRKKLNVR